MELVAAKCTQCAGEIAVDPAQDAAVCKHCGTPFIVKQAINNYNTTLNINDSGVTADSLIAHADILLQDGNFAKADATYEKVLERAPHDHRAHWGKLLCKLNVSDVSDQSAEAVVKRNFHPSVQTEEAASRFVDHLCRPHYNNAMRFAPEDAKTKYKDFYDKLMSVTREGKDYAIKYREEVQCELIPSIQSSMVSINSENDMLQKNFHKLKKKAKLYMVIAISCPVIFMLSIFICITLAEMFDVDFIDSFFSIFMVVCFLIMALMFVISKISEQKAVKIGVRMSLLSAEGQRLGAEMQTLNEAINELTNV